MRGEIGDAVSRQGISRDELLDAIMGYSAAKDRVGARSTRDEEMMRAIMAGGALAGNPQLSDRVSR